MNFEGTTSLNTFVSIYLNKHVWMMAVCITISIQFEHNYSLAVGTWHAFRWTYGLLKLLYAHKIIYVTYFNT